MIIKTIRQGSSGGGSGREKYLTKNNRQEWSYQNFQKERTLTGISREQFGDDKNKHFVVSFPKDIKMDDSHREAVRNFWSEKFNDRYVKIVQHENHFHVLLSRSQKDGNLLDMKRSEYMRMGRNWHDLLREKNLVPEKYYPVMDKFGEKREAALSKWEHQSYERVNSMAKEHNVDMSNIESFKGAAKAIGERARVLLNEGRLTETKNLFKDTGADISRVKTNAGRERVYIKFENFKGKEVKVRLDRLNPLAKEKVSGLLKEWEKVKQELKERETARVKIREEAKTEFKDQKEKIRESRGLERKIEYGIDRAEDKIKFLKSRVKEEDRAKIEEKKEDLLKLKSEFKTAKKNLNISKLNSVLKGTSLLTKELGELSKGLDLGMGRGLGRIPGL